MFRSFFLHCWTLACRRIGIATTALLGLVLLAATASAQTDLRVGFSGTVKLGHWTPITLTVPSQTPALNTAASLEIAMIDGDESPVVYAWPAKPVPSSQIDVVEFPGLCRFGRRFGSVKATLKDADNKEIFTSAMELENSSLTLAASTDYLTILVSDNDAFSTSVKKTLGVVSSELSRDSDQHVVQISADGDLPFDELGWHSVNRVILSCPSASALIEWPPEKWAAISNWVGSGGQLVLIGDPEDLELLSVTPLQDFLPAIATSGEMTSSRELERFVGNSRRRLINRGDPGIKFIAFSEPLPSASSVLMATDENSQLIFRLAEGFGQVMFVGFNLESQRLAQWESYSVLLEKALASGSSAQSGGQAEQRNEANRAGTAVTHYGYDDLAGQLRVPLDDFSTVHFLDFTLIAILIGLYILCISFGDYFFLKRFAKRMEMTWITFPLIALLFCGVAWGIAAFTRPSTLQVNQLEIIDITPDEDYSRGTSWVNIYSPSGQNIDVALASETALGLDVAQSAVTWQGLPGNGLGGMETVATTGFKRTAYRQTGSDPDGNGLDVAIEQLPLQVSSTRSLVANFKLENPPSISSQLLIRRDRLQGTFKNPLDVPIFNGKIFFGSYVYRLKKTMQPGDVVFMETGADEKTIRTYLNQTSAKGTTGNDAGRTQNRPWNPRDKSLTRIADVMMFFEAAGGKTYTGLSHGYIARVDCTPLLELNRAVLVGQLQSGSQLKINGSDTSELYDSSVTMVRIVLPVENQ